MIIARLDGIMYSYKEEGKSPIMSRDPSKVGFFTQKIPKGCNNYLIAENEEEAVKLFRKEAFEFLQQYVRKPSNDIKHYSYYVYIYPINDNRFNTCSTNFVKANFDGCTL